MNYPIFNGFQNPMNMNQQVLSPTMAQSQYTVQNNGFISVPSEDVARNYPVAPGNSVTFKNENAPYVYTKTMGFSQLDRPLFEKYRLVKEEDTPSQGIDENTSTQEADSIKYLVQEDLDPMVKDIDNLKTKIKKIDSVLEELKSSCDSSVKQITTTKSAKNSTETKGGK